VFKKIIGMFFGWETVYLTSNLDEYIRIRGNLMDNGVSTKTKTNDNTFRQSDMLMGSNTNNSYEILVRKEDVYKANEIIRRHS